MRLLRLFAAGLFTVSAYAATPTSPSSPDEGQLLEQGHYLNKDGQELHSPAHTKTGKAPKGATALCRDNTYSFSQHHRGTCSHHGGVAKWIDG